MDTTSAIIIPTGRNGYCCVLPCGCTMSLFSLLGAGLLFGVWRRMARRHGFPTRCIPR